MNEYEDEIEDEHVDRWMPLSTHEHVARMNSILRRCSVQLQPSLVIPSHLQLGNLQFVNSMCSEADVAWNSYFSQIPCMK